MKFRAFFGNTVAIGLGNWRLWLLHVVANPLLFGLFAAWLLIPEAHAWQLVLSFTVLAVLVAAVLLLHAATLSYFLDSHRSADKVGVSWIRALRHLIAFAICVAILYCLWRGAGALERYQVIVPTYVRSTLPAFLRRLLSLSALMRIFYAALFALRWIVIPGLLLPSVARAANAGFASLAPGGLALAWRVIGKFPYWLAMVAAALVGICLSSAILSWKPKGPQSSITYETVSLVLRLAAVYALALASWLLTGSLLGRTLFLVEPRRDSSA